MQRILCNNHETRFSRSSPLLAQHSQEVPSEPEEAPGPGWDSGRDWGTRSTAMSKSDTFHGPGGFRTPSAPGGKSGPPSPPTFKSRRITETQEKRQEREMWVTQHKKKSDIKRRRKQDSGAESSGRGEIQMLMQEVLKRAEINSPKDVHLRQISEKNHNKCLYLIQLATNHFVHNIS